MTGNQRQAIVIGGGLAGLATAVALAPRGFRVTVLESRDRLGGRAGSFRDAQGPRDADGSVPWVDACQHVSMGCCTNFDWFCRTIGVRGFLKPEPVLYFMTPDGRVSRFRADPWPAPLHLGRALAGAHYLSSVDKLRIGYGFAAMLRESSQADMPLADWLQRHGQTGRTVARFWGLVLVSALNETADNVGFKYARKVFVDGFLRHRDGFVVHLPTVPLNRFYGKELADWLDRHGARLRLQSRVKGLSLKQGRVDEVVLQDGSRLQADEYILATPFERAWELLPEPLRHEPAFVGIQSLSPSPITSVHCWFDRPVMSWPHLVLVDGVGHWIFNRGETNNGEYYLQVVTSASGQLRALGHEQVRKQIFDELRRLFPAVGQARLLRARVVTEQAATFRPVPGVDRFRPAQQTPVPNLSLAGDWTATEWPATMEGAVRSGLLAAEAVLKRHGHAERLLQPDLGVTTSAAAAELSRTAESHSVG